MHIFFNCVYARAAWFANPWYIRTDLLCQNLDSLVTTILNLANSNHPNATLSNIFTFLWCLWKFRNDKVFQRKDASPIQVFHAAQAIINSLSLEQNINMQETATSETGKDCKHKEDKYVQGNTVNLTEISTSTKIFTDAAWNKQEQSSVNGTGKTGIGISIEGQERRTKWQIKISATAMQAQSAIHAEALAIKLAAIIINMTGIHEAAILTDNLTLAKAAAAREPTKQPGHWMIRGILADFCALTSSSHVQVFHVRRNQNSVAHDAAKLAYSQEFNPNQHCVTTCTIAEHQRWHHSLKQVIQDVSQKGYAINHVSCCYNE